jgi:hypothetical protein
LSRNPCPSLLSRYPLPESSEDIGLDREVEILKDMMTRMRENRIEPKDEMDLETEEITGHEPSMIGDLLDRTTIKGLGMTDVSVDKTNSRTEGVAKDSETTTGTDKDTETTETDKDSETTGMDSADKGMVTDKCLEDSGRGLTGLVHDHLDRMMTESTTLTDLLVDLRCWMFGNWRSSTSRRLMQSLRS